MILYWIYFKKDDKISTDGYVGITKNFDDRISNHKVKLKYNSHKNHLLQKHFNKYGKFYVKKIFEGDDKECILKETQLRPQKYIGLNVLMGGGMPPSKLGYHWYTDGKVNVQSKRKPKGFKPGKTQKKGSEHKLYGRKKHYKVIGFEKGHIPWNKDKKGITNLQSKPKIECPYCFKVGGLPQMKQWHFDNCKEYRYGK